MANAPARMGRYELVETIGEGAMGLVYRARDPQLGRAVAIKVLRGDHTAERSARLLREAQAMAVLNHPNLVIVYDAGEDDARVFLAMELVDGTSLRAWFESHGLTWRDRLRAVVAAGRGLAAAHEAGVVHRDFKPENILVDDRGRIKVTDFGLARAEMTGGPIDHGLPMHETATGSVFGTPAYMAPEQHAGTGADARSDQFAFAVTAWESIWGQRPFITESLAALTFAIRDGAIDTPPVVKGVPPRLEQILRRALAVDPAARYASLASLLDELDGILGPPRRRRWPILVIAAVVIASLGGAGVWLATQRRREGVITDAPIAYEQEAAVPEQLRAVIVEHADELNHCYAEGKQSKPHGVVGLRFEIESDGHVRKVEIERDEFPGSSIARCVAAASLQWDFPPGTPGEVHGDISLGR